MKNADKKFMNRIAVTVTLMGLGVLISGAVFNSGIWMLVVVIIGVLFLGHYAAEAEAEAIAEQQPARAEEARLHGVRLKVEANRNRYRPCLPRKKLC